MNEKCFLCIILNYIVVHHFNKTSKGDGGTKGQGKDGKRDDDMWMKCSSVGST